MTMEISCCKYPLGNTLANYWDYNRDAMTELLLQPQRGVKGLVLNENQQPISWTQIMIDDRRPVVPVTQQGEFWRVLLAGTYTLKVLYRGYEVHRQSITIQDAMSPLNINITVPSSTYNSYTYKPFQLKDTNSSSSRYYTHFLLRIFVFLYFFGMTIRSFSLVDF